MLIPNCLQTITNIILDCYQSPFNNLPLSLVLSPVQTRSTDKYPLHLFIIYQMDQQNKAQSLVQSQSKEVTNPSISRLNQKYQRKISSGEIAVTSSRTKGRLSPGEVYDMRVKERKIQQAQKERQELQKKLEYLNRSIQSIKDYDYTTAKGSPSGSPRGASPPPSTLQNSKQILKQLKQEKARLEQKKRQSLHRQQQKLRLGRQLQVRQCEQQKTRKKQQIFQNMQKIKSRMQNRQQKIRRQEQEYHKVIGGTTLFKKLEKEYAQHEKTVLEERKKKLANIRNLHKPVSLIEIEEHERKFLEVLEEKKSLRERERRLSNAVQQYKVSYKSPHHQIYSQEHYTAIEGNQSKIKIDKMKQFSQHVRENFAPQVDDRKRDDIEKKISEENEKINRREGRAEEDRQRVEETRSKGLRYLEEMRDLPKKRQSFSQVGPVTERPRYKNYLTHSQQNGKTKWGSILDSKVSKKDKAIRLQIESEKMQTSLKQKQQKARVLKKDEDEVDEEYYEMIKAKLELLQI